MHQALVFFGTVGLLAVPLVAGAQLDQIVILAGDVAGIVSTTVIIVFSIAVLVFGWGIVKYLTAAGDSAKVKEAQVFLWWGIIGMFVLAAVFGIIQFIGTQLGINTKVEGVIKPPTVRRPGT